MRRDSEEVRLVVFLASLLVGMFAWDCELRPAAAVCFGCAAWMFKHSN